MKARITKIYPSCAWFEQAKVLEGLTGTVVSKNATRDGFEFSFDRESLKYIKENHEFFSLDDYMEIFAHDSIYFALADYE